MEITAKQIKMNEFETDQCICRTKKKCNKCHKSIKIGEICFRYGSVYFPKFMCIECKDKKIIGEMVEKEKQLVENSKEWGLNKDEYKKYIEPDPYRFIKKLQQYHNYKSPFFKQKDRLCIPDVVFKKILNSPYAKKQISVKKC